LKFLLDKAEKEILEKDKRIAILEKIIKSLGGYIPGKNEKDYKDIEKKMFELGIKFLESPRR
jgi:hypothetical protein